MSTTRYHRTVSTDLDSLTDAEQSFWRQWLTLNARVPVALHRQLHDESGLSLQDFEVLVQLTESPDGRLRVSDLANALSWERSRLSHHLGRMGGRGLVDREECEDDGRGSLVVVTQEGRQALQRAVPAHVRTVRDLVFASMDDAQLGALTAFAQAVLSRLDGGGLGTAEPARTAAGD
jgi:DNA-binding MarR family transcriptional regulator